MKSQTSPTPSMPRNRVSRTLVSGMYICLLRDAPFAAESAKRPPRSSSRMAANTLGESKFGRQHQSMDPSIPTSATECMSPMTP